MANALFDKAREFFLGQATALDWDSQNIKACLVDHGVDTPVPATDDFLDDISTAVISTSPNFTTKTVTAGVADADNVTFTSVSGATVESIVIYSDSGSAATSPLIAYIDTATGLPLTPNGGDVIVQWDDGTNKIFKL